jgi:hypothetical protein
MRSYAAAAWVGAGFKTALPLCMNCFNDFSIQMGHQYSRNTSLWAIRNKRVINKHAVSMLSPRAGGANRLTLCQPRRDVIIFSRRISLEGLTRSCIRPLKLEDASHEWSLSITAFPVTDVTGCWAFSLDLSDAGDCGGARSRRQARDHVTNALYISCSLRPTPKSRLLVIANKENPILCSHPAMHSPPQLRVGMLVKRKSNPIRL